MAYFGTALITGCGGDVACSLARIARRASLFERLIGCDLKEDHDGLEYFDRCHTALRTDDPGYFDRLSQIVRAEGVDLIIPATDMELGAFFATGQTDTFERCDVLMASHDAVKVGLDKLSTAKFLSDHGLPAPWTVDASEQEPVEFPCIFKPRKGQGSKGVVVVSSSRDLVQIDRAIGIFQQYLADDDNEFTSGLYRTRGGEVRHVSFRRRLSGGLTGSGVVESSPAISAFLDKVAAELSLTGSINLQFRIHDGLPYAFEINPRFSSTVRFRDRLGFRDFVWSVQERAGKLPAPFCGVKPGVRIRRQMEIISQHQDHGDPR